MTIGMSEAPPTQSRITKTELAAVVIIVGGGLAILFPALYGSREKARAYFCQENLRRLDSALHTYVTLQQRFPDARSWPLDLLPILSRQPKQLSISGVPMQEPRPPYLTCPSNPESTVTRPFDQISLYVAIRSFDENGEESWVFRDRSAKPPMSTTDHWCVGIVLNDVESRQQLARPGPHGYGYYQQSDGRGYGEQEE